MVAKIVKSLILTTAMIALSCFAFPVQSKDREGMKLIKRMENDGENNPSHPQDCQCLACHHARISPDALRFPRPRDMPHNVITDVICRPCDDASDTCLDIYEVLFNRADQSLRQRREERESRLQAQRARQVANAQRSARMQHQNSLNQPLLSESNIDENMIEDHFQYEEPPLQTMTRSRGPRSSVE